MTLILSQYYQEAASWYGYTGNVSSSSGFALTIAYTKKHHPEEWTSLNQRLLPAQLPGFVGGYPANTSKERGIDGLMIALMLLVLIAYGVQFFRNAQVGHFFYPSLLVMLHCVLAAIGWGLRIGWSSDISSWHMGMASYVLITLTEYLLPICNYFYAFRLFRFVHPKKPIIAGIHIIGPAAGITSFVLCIVGPSLQFFSFQEYAKLQSIQQVNLAGGILGIIFHTIPVTVVIAAFARRRVRKDGKDEHTVLLQPYWITDFKPFSRFEPQPGSVPATHSTLPMKRAPGRGHFTLSNAPMTNGPLIKTCILTIIPSVFLLWSSSLMRTLSIGYANQGYTAEVITNMSDPVTLKSYWFPSSAASIWVFYGGVQTLTLLFWLVMRVDLRFFVPTEYLHVPSTPDQYHKESLETLP